MQYEFDKVYSDYKGMVSRFTAQRLSQFEAEELTNDVFMKVHKHLNKFDDSKGKISTKPIEKKCNVMPGKKKNCGKIFVTE